MNKCILILICVLALSTAMSSNQEHKHPDCVRQECPLGEYKNILYPGDCSKYIECSNGVSTVKECSKQTSFSKGVGKCIDAIGGAGQCIPC